MTWNLLQEKTFADSNHAVCEIDLKSSNTLKNLMFLASGELSTGQQDYCKCLIRINGQSSGYNSFVIMAGNASGGEWDSSGFYAGRNGWGTDAGISIEYTISVASLANKRVGYGMATFAQADNRILGYTCNGFLVANDPVQSVELVFTNGGVATFTTTIYTD